MSAVRIIASGLISLSMKSVIGGLMTSVAVLGARGAQEVRALAVEEHGGAEVDVRLEVAPLGVGVRDRRARAETGAVDQHVEQAVALAVRRDDLLTPSSSPMLAATNWTS